MRALSLLLLIALSSTTFAQKKDVREKDVPVSILNSFTAKYPAAKTRTWKTKNGDYEVDFYISLKKHEAKYQADGTWKKTSVKIDKKEVPEVVFNSLKSSEFSNWTLDDTYLVEDIENKDLYMFKVLKGSNVMELLYKSNGDLLKAKNKTDTN